MSRRLIPVAFSTDDNYVVPTYIAAYSLLKNSCGESDIDLYILTPEVFSQKSIDLLQSLTTQFDFLKLRIISITDHFSNFKTNNPRISVSTMYKLLIPQVMEEEIKFDKCIFLDSDVVVEGNIVELLNVDLDGYIIGGVKDRLYSGKEQIYLKGKLDIPSFDNYVNAGVLLFNLEMTRKHTNLTKELEEAGYRREYPFNDQDAMNTVCYGRIKILPLKYNINTACLFDRGPDFYNQYGKDNIIDARKNPVVVHYNTWRKPWNVKCVPMASRWWKYVRMQNNEISIEYIQPFLSDNRIQMRNKPIEVLRTGLIYLGIYNQIKSVVKRYIP